MKKLLLLIAIVVANSACATPIDLLTQELNERESGVVRGLWKNGMAVSPDLPKEASEEELIKEYFKVASFTEGKPKNIQIIETKEVYIGERIERNRYRAVYIETEIKNVVILTQYATEQSKPYWWVRSFDIPQKINPNQSGDGQ